MSSSLKPGIKDHDSGTTALGPRLWDHDSGTKNIGSGKSSFVLSVPLLDLFYIV